MKGEHDFLSIFSSILTWFSLIIYTPQHQYLFWLVGMIEVWVFPIRRVIKRKCLMKIGDSNCPKNNDEQIFWVCRGVRQKSTLALKVLNIIHNLKENRYKNTNKDHTKRYHGVRPIMFIPPNTFLFFKFRVTIYKLQLVYIYNSPVYKIIFDLEWPVYLSSLTMNHTRHKQWSIIESMIEKSHLTNDIYKSIYSSI
jgi:hypothetical protein